MKLLKYLQLLTVTIIFALSSSPSSQAAEAKFSWLPNNASDGTVGYKLHYGTSSRSYAKSIDIGCPALVSGRIYASVSQLTSQQTYYFTVTAYNAKGVESSYSKEIAYTPDTAPNTPPPPSGTLNDKFQQTYLSNHIEYYTDRTYTLTSVPSAYVGMDIIKTPNNDNSLTAASNYLIFELDSAATVYVAYDSRAKSLPNWMSGFSDTGDVLSTSLSTQPQLKIYRRSYSAGAIVNLGANKAAGFSGGTVSNYIVFSGNDTTPPPPAGTLNDKFQQTYLSNHIEYYTDRTYTLTSVPSAYVGMDIIKTPNNDNSLTAASNYLIFELDSAATVYVAYDSRAKSLPNWMSGFSDTGDVLSTSLSTQPQLKIYRRSYPAGATVNLGANKAAGFSGGTVSNYIVFYD